MYNHGFTNPVTTNEENHIYGTNPDNADKNNATFFEWRIGTISTDWQIKMIAEDADTNGKIVSILNEKCRIYCNGNFQLQSSEQFTSFIGNLFDWSGRQSLKWLDDNRQRTRLTSLAVVGWAEWPRESSMNTQYNVWINDKSFNY